MSLTAADLCPRFCLDDKTVDDRAVPIKLVSEDQLGDVLATLEPPAGILAAVQGFKAKANSQLIVPGEEGASLVLVGLGKGEADLWSVAHLPDVLPEGRYVLDPALPSPIRADLALGWVLGAYRFPAYKEVKLPDARLCLNADLDRDRLEALVAGIYIARDLVNRPTNHMGPRHLAEAVQEVGADCGAKVTVLTGQELLDQNWPAVHAVGRAAEQEPRVIQLFWEGPNGKAADAKANITLVGKGVCFDTGGLNLKPGSNMKMMKKDMGGAASSLCLARMIMALKLPVNLRLIIPAVENSVSGNAFRPQDVIETRKGLTVEILNTDAEGRVILSDALFEAGEVNESFGVQAADLIFDFATLTGAARVALGTECPAIFCNDDDLAQGLKAASDGVKDPLWQLPLVEGYRKQTESKVADLNNCPDGGFGGAITAALYLQAFVPDGTPWMHMDMMGWNQRKRPGRPEGGETGAVRACLAYLEERFC
ncbi:MAG: leucyl aminopeptidase family protein [Magnetovibrionaceae bacterium]